jgi:hypothetical protein
VLAVEAVKLVWELLLYCLIVVTLPVILTAAFLCGLIDFARSQWGRHVSRHPRR